MVRAVAAPMVAPRRKWRIGVDELLMVNLWSTILTLDVEILQ